MKKIFLIDGNALIYRMFYALPDFTTKEGKSVNAIFGVAKFFTQDMVKQKPDYLIFIRDSKGKNFRHEIFSDYKATRERMPDNLKNQVDDINKMVNMFGNEVIEYPKVEADDVIATLATKLGENKENDIYILSGDKDLYSLVSDNVKIYDSIKKKIYDEEKTEKKFGIKPKNIIDYLSIVGDSADNIPGISGIGPKKAVPLINQIGSLEDIYEFINSGKEIEDIEIKKILSGKSLEKIVNSKDVAFLSKKLATMKKNLDFSDFDLENYKLKEDKLFNDDIIKLFQEYEFNSLLGDKFKKQQRKWEDLGLKVKIIGDKNGFEELKSQILEKKEIVLDTETTSLDIMKAKLVGISLLLDEKNIFYINLRHNGPKVEADDLIEFLDFLLKLDITIVGHNLKYDLEIIQLFLNGNKNTENEHSKVIGQMTLGL